MSNVKMWRSLQLHLAISMSWFSALEHSMVLVISSKIYNSHVQLTSFVEFTVFIEITGSYFCLSRIIN